jgi:hypothetical protein
MPGVTLREGRSDVRILSKIYGIGLSTGHGKPPACVSPRSFPAAAWKSPEHRGSDALLSVKRILDRWSHPYIAVDMAPCIDCYRCVRAHLRRAPGPGRLAHSGPWARDAHRT